MQILSSQHERNLRPMHLLGKGRLPYLYWLPKLHKNPPSQRFIAGSGNCTTSVLSELLSEYLNFVLRVLRVKDEHHLLLTGVRRFFVVTGYEEVAEFFSRWPRTSRVAQQFLYTGDFSTMYTTIPHRDLLQVCSGFFERLGNGRRRNGLEAGRESPCPTFSSNVLLME